MFNWNGPDAPRTAEEWQTVVTFAFALLVMGATNKAELENVLKQGALLGYLPEENAVEIFKTTFNSLVQRGIVRGGEASKLK